MSPVEDDPTFWTAVFGAAGKFSRHVLDSLSFTMPFIGPAFIGAVLSATRKSYRDKGFAYWVSAVCWSTTAGAVLTPAFAHIVGISGDIAGSTAALVAILGHESIGFFFRHFGAKEVWNGEERRAKGAVAPREAEQAEVPSAQRFVQEERRAKGKEDHHAP